MANKTTKRKQNLLYRRNYKNQRNKRTTKGFRSTKKHIKISREFSPKSLKDKIKKKAWNKVEELGLLTRKNSKL